MTTTAGSDPTSRHEIAFELRREDLIEYYLYLWRHRASGLPRFVRGWLWVVSIYLGYVLAGLIVDAVGGLAVGLYFLVAGVSSPAQRAIGLPGIVLALYIVTAVPLLIYGFWRGHVFWRFIGWVLRLVQRRIISKIATLAVTHRTSDAASTYRVTLISTGVIRVAVPRAIGGGLTSAEPRLAFAPWPTIGAVKATADHVFLNSCGGETVVLVPAHAFPDATAFAQFVAATRQFREQAFRASESAVDTLLRFPGKEPSSAERVIPVASARSDGGITES